MTKQITTLMCSLAVASCAPNYVYRPAENATATIKGRLAGDYQIPANAPEGDVRLASFGMSKISASEARTRKQKAVHVRMIVTDDSRTPWSVNTRQQAIMLPDGRQLAPAYVSTHEGQTGLPTVTVPARGKRIIDLFYPLPADMRRASQLPAFTVVWHVDTPQQQVTARTRFDRMSVEPPAAHLHGLEWDALGDGPGGGAAARADLGWYVGNEGREEREDHGEHERR